MKTPGTNPYPRGRVLGRYVVCTGALAGVLHALLLSVWGSWQMPQMMVLAALGSVWRVLAFGIGGAVWLAPVGLAAGAVAAFGRLYHRPASLLLPALAAAVCGILVYRFLDVLLAVWPPPFWLNLGADIRRAVSGGWLPAAVCGAAAWLAGWFALPYGEEEEAE
ncbi:MAG: hypothetical protein Q4A62_07355 [Eikenella sp.]|nr:hypothetical protein [Eikenella sp.]